MAEGWSQGERGWSETLAGGPVPARERKLETESEGCMSAWERWQET